MTDKELNQAVCIKLQKAATLYFNRVSDNLKSFGTSFTTSELIKLQKRMPTIFGMSTKFVVRTSLDFSGNVLKETHRVQTAGRDAIVCYGSFKCSFDLAGVFVLLSKFEKLSRMKTVFIINEKQIKNKQS